MRARFGVRDDQLLIVFSAKLLPRKDPMTLLRAVDAMRHRDRAAVLFLGHGELREQLASFARERGLTTHFRRLRQPDRPAEALRRRRRLRAAVHLRAARNGAERSDGLRAAGHHHRPLRLDRRHRPAWRQRLRLPRRGRRRSPATSTHWSRIRSCAREWPRAPARSSPGGTTNAACRACWRRSRATWSTITISSARGSSAAAARSCRTARRRARTSGWRWSARPQRFHHAFHAARVVPGGDDLARAAGHARAQLGIGGQRVEMLRQRLHVAGREDEAVVAVLHDVADRPAAVGDRSPAVRWPWPR